jgi:CubicO group peptidase (beta-lactamase class C family)
MNYRSSDGRKSGLASSLLAVCAALWLATATFSEPRDAATSDTIRAMLENVVMERDVPGMVAAIADSDGVIGIGAAGVRKAGTDVKMTVNDLVHIGSCTKAMTSTVLATLVEDGLLTWGSTLADVIPELTEAVHDDYHDVTLWELVTHRGRFPANAKQWWAHGGLDLRERRLELLKDRLQDAPSVKEGAYQYSNLGYVAAACMAEAVTGETWESLIRERLFEPLGMTSAGFGPPGESGETDQPWGHVKSREVWQPSQLDNAEALGPAGRVHCTLEDWARFGALQLRERDPAILNREVLDRLTTTTADYAAGWGVAEREWAGGTAFTHNGSNTMWYATIWVAPEIDRILLVAANAGGETTAKTCDHVAGKLVAIDRNRMKREGDEE